MSSLFQTIDKIKPVYDRTYALVMFLCKLLLTVDILITCMAVAVTFRLSRIRPGVRRLY